MRQQEYRENLPPQEADANQQELAANQKELAANPQEPGTGRQESFEKRVSFMLREIQNQIRQIIHKSSPRFEKGPRSQLQGGILGYLFHHRDGPVYQRDLEKEFRISRATATNTLQVMERDGLIVRRAQDRDARLKRIQMTDEAYQNHRQIEAHMDMMDRRMQQGMSDEEAQELRRLLGILQKNLEELDTELGGSPQEEEWERIPNHKPKKQE